MIFVIVRRGTDIIGKEAYAGDISGIQELLDKRLAQDGTLSFEVLNEEDRETFEQLSLAERATPEKVQWQAEKAKGIDAAIAFLAKRMGLE